MNDRLDFANRMRARRGEEPLIIRHPDALHPWVRLARWAPAPLAPLAKRFSRLLDGHVGATNALDALSPPYRSSWVDGGDVLRVHFNHGGDLASWRLSVVHEPCDG